MHSGYVKLWRKLQNSDLWTQEKFTRGQAWIDLIMLANHKEGYIRIRGIKIDIDRGQLACSELTLSKRWKWSRGKVRRFLSELEANPVHQIVQQKNNLTSLIKIINYDLYQGTGQQTEHQAVQQTDTKQNSKRYTNNNVKNVKKERTKKEPKNTPARAYSSGVESKEKPQAAAFKNKPSNPHHYSKIIPEPTLGAIVSACQEIDKLHILKPKPKVRRFEPHKWVQKATNHQANFQAIEMTLKRLIQYWDSTKNPNGYIEKIFKVENQNLNERSGIAEHQAHKNAPVPEKLKTLTKEIGGD